MTSASLVIQQAFSKPCLVNLILKDTHLIPVFSIYFHDQSNTSYKSQVSSTGVTTGSKRSYSETVVYRDIRRSVEKKHITPEEKQVLHRGSYMSAHVLLNLLNELGKEIKCEACLAFYLFFATS